MKFLIITLAAIFSLGACSPKSGVMKEDDARAPIFYQKGTSDKQMTHDLNACALEAFKDAEAADGVTGKFSQSVSQKTCMHSRGYEVFYN